MNKLSIIAAVAMLSSAVTAEAACYDTQVIPAHMSCGADNSNSADFASSICKWVPQSVKQVQIMCPNDCVVARTYFGSESGPLLRDTSKLTVDLTSTVTGAAFFHEDVKSTRVMDTTTFYSSKSSENYEIGYFIDKTTSYIQSRRPQDKNIQGIWLAYSTPSTMNKTVSAQFDGWNSNDLMKITLSRTNGACQ